MERLQTIKNRSLEEFPLKDKETKGHYLERGSGVKSFFLLFKEGSCNSIFLDVGTNLVQRRKIELPLLK